MKDIFIIRHGETDHNLHGVVQGSGIDSSLNAKGREQALKFYEKYKNVPFDKIYVSTLRRTKETVAPFLGQEIPYEAHAELNEICWGKFEGQSIHNNHRPYFETLLQRWREGELHETVEGGESPLDVAQRQKKFIEMMLGREEERTVLICMHGRAMRIFLCLLMQTPIIEMDVYQHGNLSLYRMQLENGKMKLIENNNQKHLDKAH